MPNPTPLFPPTPQRPSAVAGLLAAALLGLAGCADVSWARAVYQGEQRGTQQCALLRRPADAPCAALPDYDRFQAERARLTGGASPVQAPLPPSPPPTPPSASEAAP